MSVSSHERQLAADGKGKIIPVTERFYVGCLGAGKKKTGPCQDGRFYVDKCACSDCQAADKENNQ